MDIQFIPCKNPNSMPTSFGKKLATLQVTAELISNSWWTMLILNGINWISIRKSLYFSFACDTWQPRATRALGVAVAFPWFPSTWAFCFACQRLMRKTFQHSICHWLFVDLFNNFPLLFLLPITPVVARIFYHTDFCQVRKIWWLWWHLRQKIL